MLARHFQRFAEAKKRLAAALTAGEDTTHHRAAISSIERDIYTATRSQQQAAQADEQRRAEATTSRTARIVADVRQRIASSIPPIPASPGEYTHVD